MKILHPCLCQSNSNWEPTHQNSVFHANFVIKLSLQHDFQIVHSSYIIHNIQNVKYVWST